MKNASKTLTVNLVMIGVLVVQTQPAFAYITLNGTVPAATQNSQGIMVIIQKNQTGAKGTLKFKFSAPAPSPSPAFSNYVLSFCIAPPEKPCSDPSTEVYRVDVPGGEERLAVFDASIFETHVLAVASPISAPIPFSVTME